MPNLLEMSPDQITAQLEANVIAAQNDLFRKALTCGASMVEAALYGIKGRVLLTQGVSNSGGDFQTEAMAAVAAFETFTTDNDPHGDHSFGAITIQGEKLFWKIDLYDLDFVYGSDAPADPTKTMRVLTIMYAQEY